MSSTTYPYDLLKTDKNLSVKDIEKDPSIYIRTFTPESIIYKYKTDIDIFIKNNKLDINILKNNNLNTILKDISNKFKNILINLSKINEMKNFLQNLIKNDKNELNKNKKFIDLFILYTEKIQQINLHTLYNENQYLYNPINNYTKISFNNTNNKTQYFINKINDFNSENQSKVKILFDIISQGDCLNLLVFRIPCLSQMGFRNFYLNQQ
jgi:hypothetical protein